MTVHTQTDALLTLTLDTGTGPQDYSCQLINAEFTQPSSGDGTVTPNACGDTVVEPGEPQPGSITGEVFKDATVAGFTRILAAAVAAAQAVDYTYVENTGTPHELKFTGQLTVGAFPIPFTPTRKGRHGFTLTVGTATLAAAFAAAAAQN